MWQEIQRITLKKKFVPKLECSQEMEGEENKNASLRFELGNEKKIRRLNEASTNLKQKPPNPSESELMHSFYLNYKSEPSKFIPISETKLEKNILLHSQNMNIHGKVFGGFIMRNAIELGYCTALKHCAGENPEIVCIDNVNFLKPAKIGSIGNYVAKVSFVHDNLINISIECYIIDKNEKILTTIVDITYLAKRDPKLVVPTLYEDSAIFIEGKRKLERLFTY